MTIKDYDLNLWEPNFAEIPAVQGETLSRTVNIHLKEEISVQNALGNLEIRPKPVDVTGYSIPRMYITKSDGKKTFFDGTITDATNGTVSFVLPYQATTAPDENTGIVYMTKPDGSTLIATGITLNVRSNNLDGAIESTDEFSALVTALNKADAAAATAQQAAVDAQEADQKANDVLTAANQVIKAAGESTEKADSAADTALQAAQDALNSHSMVSPITHYLEPIGKVINDVFASMMALGGGTPTAAEYAALGLTTEQYAAKGLNAAQYVMAGKTMLGG